MKVFASSYVERYGRVSGPMRHPLALYRRLLLRWAIFVSIMKAKLIYGLLLVLVFVASIPDMHAQQMHSTLDIKEFLAAVEKAEGVLVDVRTPREYASGHIPGSINIDWTAADYEQKMAILDPKRPVLLYCAIGGRSDQAREYLQAKGYKAHDLEDGIAAWKEAGLPVER
jgi:phage shock protein E